ncbi:transcriptional regulator family: Fungal Specific TF [Aspergillus niger]|nr:transcriptional regulator family: Fungal Specific TF [Aspergillus niger]KAI2857874.1 transcriptional regulator family: Fungal Specific TF [Aspergillus niger]KAI2873638.1 transcriptional regulator family: Fungal Specific TF [Aspergillus niger]KAI2890949.1 transcriptional regulator family: Fungal Specific TF [Aspergillus niger]KAI3065546.1 transcriptional regulator family: Fungal Specific TF [Aspergillus niger]
MATVASTSVMNDQDTEKVPRADHSPSRFTAVNGKEPSVTAGAVPTPAVTDCAAESPDVFVRNGLDAQSRLDEQIQGNVNPESGNSANEQEEPHSQRSPSLSGSSGPSKSKRKRSESGEQEESHGMLRRAPKSPVLRSDDTSQPLTQTSTSNDTGMSHGESDIKHPSPSTQARLEENGSDNRTPPANTAWHDYDSQLVHQAQRAQQFDASDAQLAEALQREANGHDSSQKNWGTSGRPTEGPAQSEQPSSLSVLPQERPQAAVQVAPKRKRVFSNRTKTGCMTCRRRKKKCDEQHPACNNCIRGGFLCEGYSSRSTWQKPSNSKTPVPLQSKEGYLDINSQYVHDISQHDRQQTMPEQLDPGKIRPIVVDESDRATASFNTSPTGASSGRGPWTKRSWGSTNHPSYISDHVAKPDYREVPSIHELSREGHAKSDFPIVPPIRELSHGGHTKPGTVPLFQGGMDQRSTHSGNVDTNSPQAQARMALSIEHQLSTRTLSTEDTEKDKMIRGDLYRPYDVHLVEERDRCKAALWRFNNACNPISGLSTKEQSRLLKEVLVPPGSVINSPPGLASSRSTGSLGQGAIVEAPFYCHYGYNVHIGEDVMVSENCLFVDDCPNAKAHKADIKGALLQLRKIATLGLAVQSILVFDYDAGRMSLLER